MLAELRALPGVRMTIQEERVWVVWDALEDRFLHRLLGVAGVAFYVEHDRRWHRLACSLPTFRFPAEAAFRPLSQVLFPSPCCPLPAPTSFAQPILLRLTPDRQSRPTSALDCSLVELARWADTIPRARLAGLQACTLADRVLVLGQRLPFLAESKRYWGESVLAPLGMSVQPRWPEYAIREALGVGECDLLLLETGSKEDATEAQLIARANLRPLTRAALRLACPETR